MVDSFKSLPSYYYYFLVTSPVGTRECPMPCLASFQRASPGLSSEGQTDRQADRQAGMQTSVISAYLHLQKTTESHVKIRLH